MDIKTLAIEQANRSYSGEYLESLSEEEKIVKGFAHLLSTVTGYDGAMILQVCSEALTDANFHDQSAKINEMLNTLED